MPSPPQGWALPCAVLAALLAAASAARAADPAGGRVFLIASHGVAGPVEAAAVFRTLPAFSRSVACLAPGDQVLLEGGREFTGRLRLSQCAPDSARPAVGAVVIRSFHPDAPLDPEAKAPNAVIRAAPSAADLSLAWSDAAAHFLRGKSVPLPERGRLLRIGPLPHPVTQVFHRDERLPLATFPSAAAADTSRYVPFSDIQAEGPGCPAKACLQFTGAAELDALRALARLEGEGPMHAQAIVRSSPWSLARAAIRRVVVAEGTGRLELAQTVFGPGHSTRAAPLPGHGAMLVNSPAFLDAPGEWYYDAEDRHVYLLWDRHVSAPAAADSRFALREDRGEARQRFDDAGLAISGRSTQRERTLAVSVRGITVVQPAGSGIRIRNAARADIAGSVVRQAGARGIAVIDTGERARIAGNRIEASGRTGIGVHGVPQVEITDNDIRQAGYLGGHAALEMDFMGIRLDGAYSSAVIASNRIADTGYAGIVTVNPVPDAPGARQAIKLDIRDNDITRFCGLLNDCAGIYINGRGTDPADPVRAIPYGKFIRGNRIAEPVGNADGTPGAMGYSPDASGGRPIGAWQTLIGAIYLDHRASHFDVTGNTVTGQYGPFSWIIRYRALNNACGRDEVARCAAVHPGPIDNREVFRCYSRALSQCNAVEPQSRR